MLSILYSHHVLLSTLDGHCFAELLSRSEEEKKRPIAEVLVTWAFRYTKAPSVRRHCLSSESFFLPLPSSHVKQNLAEGLRKIEIEEK